MRDPDEDELLFSEAMADVQVIAQTRRPPEPVYHEPIPFSEREREVIRELDALVNGDAPFDLTHSDEFMSGCVPGLDPRVLRRLRGRPRRRPTRPARLRRRDGARVGSGVHRRRTRAACAACARARPRQALGRRAGAAAEPAHLARAWPARLIVLAYTSPRPPTAAPGASYVLLARRKAERR
jgi:DNA-nicking Smr family endonuclease